LIQEIQDTLKKYWGFDQLRPLQSEIIQSVLKKKDTLAVLSTGAGKSLCYQLPAMLLPGVCLVVSPLIALMEDQLLELKTKGIKAMGLYGPLSEDSLIQRLDNISYGNYKIVFIAPERLQNPIITERFAQIELSFLAIDEAHCISQWGHDFRPSYRSIGTFRAQMNKLPTLALTATATPKVIEDIRTNLLLDNVQEYLGPVVRSALAIKRYYYVNKDLLLSIALRRNPQKCILIYVRSRSKAEKLSQQLKTEG
jgi:ATP-dependent DNA helicase RecQ